MILSDWLLKSQAPQAIIVSYIVFAHFRNISSKTVSDSAKVKFDDILATASWIWQNCHGLLHWRPLE